MAANGDYRGSLNTEDVQTYITKLDILEGNVDPYRIPSSDFSKDVSVCRNYLPYIQMTVCTSCSRM